MELKKTPRADLENKRSIFVQIGLVISLGIVFMAFNLNDSVKAVDSLGSLDAVVVEEEKVAITRQEEVKPPPPPPPPKVIEQINIIDDNVELDEEFEFESTEADDRTIIDAVPVIQEETKDEEDEDYVFQVVEENPEFPGGDQARSKWLSENIKYPPIASENGISGRVYVTFVVNTDGKIVNAKVARGVDPSLDQEALRVINLMPKWKPGMQRGKPVRVSYTVPINFTLN